MAVARTRQKKKRTQISLSQEDYEQAKRIAASRGVSVSRVLTDSVREGIGKRETEDPWAKIIGMVEDADPKASVNHDEIIYGQDTH